MSQVPNGSTEDSRPGRIARLCPGRGRRRERLGLESGTPSSISMRWLIGKPSNVCVKAAGPSHSRSHGVLILSEAEKKFFGVLRQESRTSLKIFCLPKISCFDGYGAPIASRLLFVSAQTEGDRVADALHRETQDTYLRRIAILQHDFQPAVAVEIGERKSPAVVAKIQSHNTRDIRKCAVAIVGEENISLVTVPGRVGANQFVDGAPSSLVIRRRSGVLRAISRPLAARRNSKHRAAPAPEM